MNTMILVGCGRTLNDLRKVRQSINVPNGTGKNENRLGEQVAGVNALPHTKRICTLNISSQREQNHGNDLTN